MQAIITTAIKFQMHLHATMKLATEVSSPGSSSFINIQGAAKKSPVRILQIFKQPLKIF